MTPLTLFRRDAIDKTPFLNGRLVLFRLKSDREATWKCRLQIEGSASAIFLDTQSRNLVQAKSISTQLINTIDVIVANVGIRNLRTHSSFEEIERNFPFRFQEIGDSGVPSNSSEPSFGTVFVRSLGRGWRHLSLPRRISSLRNRVEASLEPPASGSVRKASVDGEGVRLDERRSASERNFFKSNGGIGLLFMIVFVLFIGCTMTFRDAFAASMQLNSIILAIFIMGFFVEYMRWRDATQETTFKMLRSRSDGASAVDVAAISLAGVYRRSCARTRDELMPVMLASARRRLHVSRVFGMFCGASLVMVGLFGTFLGLMGSVSNIRRVLDTIAPTQDIVVLFTSTQEIIFASLASMTIAFSTTFFGLIGSMLLGLLGRSVSFHQEMAFKSFELRLYGGGTQRDFDLNSEFDRIIEGSVAFQRVRLSAQQADATQASLLRHIDSIMRSAVDARRSMNLRLMSETDAIQEVYGRAVHSANRSKVGGQVPRRIAGADPAVVSSARPSMFRSLMKNEDPSSRKI
jgi:hypothetical protein